MLDLQYVVKIVLYIFSGTIFFVPITLAAFWRKKIIFSTVSEEGYVLRQSKIIFWIMIIGSIFFYFLSVVSVSAANDYAELGAGLLFMGFELLAVYIVVYYLLWEIIVEGDILTIYQPFHPVRKITIYEISEVKPRWGEYVAYIDGEKVFKFDYSTTHGIESLYERLQELGKIKINSILQKDDSLLGVKKENFIVRAGKGNMIAAFFCLLVFGGIFIFSLVDGTVEMFWGIMYVCFFIFLIGFIIYSLTWKVTVSLDTIYVKNTFWKEKKYYLSEITRVRWRKEDIVIYAGDRKIVKVPSEHKNFSYLWDWLVSKEDMEFFDGKGNHFTGKDYLETVMKR